MAKSPLHSLVSGVGKSVRDMFAGGNKSISEPGALKADGKAVDPGWPWDKPLAEKGKLMLFRYYREAAFEKTPFARKWMRNALMYAGYHDLEWSDLNVAWDAILRDADDYSFPNNHYRSRIKYGAAMYVKAAPEWVFAPGNDDFDSQAIAQACKHAFDVIKENVQYDTMRTWESLNLRLFGNSFRYSYYSIDPRYGYVTAPVFEDNAVSLAAQPPSYLCQNCHIADLGMPMNQQTGQMACPSCGSPNVAFTDEQPPVEMTVPKQVGQTKYPRGQEMCEVVNPMEVYVRSSAPDLWHAPFVLRARNVDRLVLQAAYQDTLIGSARMSSTYGTQGDATNASSSENLALIYQDSLADLPGDPTQFASWYEKAASAAKVTFIQGWFRPALYWHDKEMREKFPEGCLVECANDTLLNMRNEPMDDHWVHFPYTLVPGRFWGDGDDDLVPLQLQLNEVERLKMRNMAYNSVPQTWIDSQRVDKDNITNDPGEVNCVRTGNGRPISDAVYITPGLQLPPEVEQWRETRIQDMEFHSSTFGSAIGEHQEGVNTLGGQQMFADRAAANQNPQLQIFKEGNEHWARQMLKLVSKNWLDDRVDSAMGINGQWEFKKLRGAMVDPDQVRILAKIVPVDYAEQQGLIQAISAGALNPQDPRVQKKILEAFRLPEELATFSMDAKVQWKEIDRMKAGEAVQPTPFIQNDDVHMEICRVWLNSDEAEKMPQAKVLVFQHLMAHMQTKMLQANAAAAMQSGPAEVQQQLAGGPVQAGQPQQQGKPQQPGQQPGQPSPQDKQRRARMGQAAKPKVSQPTSGNQYNRRPR